MNKESQTSYSRKLIRFGVLLFLLGLLTGFIIPALENSRMGLSSHLEGVINGMLLIIFGIIWPKLLIEEKLLKWSFYVSIFGTYTNWFTTLAASFWGAGSELMPIAGNSMTGTPVQETVIKIGLITLSISMVFVSVVILTGLREKSVK